MNKRLRMMLAAVALSSALPGWAQELLSPEKAFQVQVQQLSPTEVSFVYQIAPGYVLYKERFGMVMSGGSAQVADIVFPAALRKYDKAMKQEMEFYRDRVTVRVKIKPGNGSQGTLVATAQGCASEQGVCYPPFNKAWSLGPLNVDSMMSNHAASCASKDHQFTPRLQSTDAC